MITNTVSWAELVRMVLFSLALIFSFKIFVSSTFDLFNLKIRRINSIREYAALTTVICYGVFAFMNFIFVCTTINAMTIPATPHVIIRSTVNTFLYISISFVSCTATFVIERRRRQLIRKIDEFENMDHVHTK